MTRPVTKAQRVVVLPGRRRLSFFSAGNDVEELSEESSRPGESPQLS